MSNGVITSSVWGKIAPQRDGSPGRVTECRSCAAPILWIEKDNGKKMPVDAKTDTSHFKTCPNANEHSASNPNRQQGQGGPGLRSQPEPTGPVWIGEVDTNDESDPTWYVIKVKCSTGDKLKPGDLVKLMRRSK